MNRISFAGAIEMSTIVVLVKQVPDTNAKISVQGGRVDLSTVKMEMSPYDSFAIETALRHKEATGGSVTALTVGAAGTEKILKDAKAMGVDNIVRVWDDAWKDLDSNALQSILKESIETLGASVVYCGKSAADTGAGSTGPGLAERLGWSNASNVIGADFGSDVIVSMPVESGVAKVSVPLPAVISCDKGEFKPRKANVKGIMMAKRAQVEVMSATAPASNVIIANHSMPAAKPAGKTFEGGSSASQVVQLLRDEANVI
ncbi:MAG: electron transfer flavoprotein subunit beta/FixA family protein [Candidatus Thermoplasmatota archaeon]|nr:electron transfer flavoprotein subunit beta/FixA family protein [Candidatus Thermoplasmatota archaeon]MEC8608995.1 electron transfer flavoprotein subunit beta/FixA family protein [Candidatus Thermoplasmatota archaeon]